MTGNKRVEMDQEGLGGLAFLRRGGVSSLPRIYDSAWLVREEKQSYLLT